MPMPPFPRFPLRAPYGTPEGGITDDMREQALGVCEAVARNLDKLRTSLGLPPEAFGPLVALYSGSLSAVCDEVAGEQYRVEEAKLKAEHEEMMRNGGGVIGMGRHNLGD